MFRLPVNARLPWMKILELELIENSSFCSGKKLVQLLFVLKYNFGFPVVPDEATAKSASFGISTASMIESSSFRGAMIGMHEPRFDVNSFS